jgi:CMP-2-keto-3-deoxyoctulosonic acid synthetase
MFSKAQIQALEDFIEAKIRDQNSRDVEDSIYLSRCRDDLMEALGITEPDITLEQIERIDELRRIVSGMEIPIKVPTEHAAAGAYLMALVSAAPELLSAAKRGLS